MFSMYWVFKCRGYALCSSVLINIYHMMVLIISSLRRLVAYSVPSKDVSSETAVQMCLEYMFPLQSNLSNDTAPQHSALVDSDHLCFGIEKLPLMCEGRYITQLVQYVLEVVFGSRL